MPFPEHSFMFIPKGVKHQHVNTGREPLWLVFVYGHTARSRPVNPSASPHPHLKR